MNIKEISQQTIWQEFFDKNGSPSFLQSWEWGEFQKKLSYKIIRLGIYKKKELLAIAQVIKIRSKRGDFLFIPHGPVLELRIKNEELRIIIRALKDYLINIAKKENFSFIRIAPILENTPENQKIFKDFCFKIAPIYMHAERVWVLDLNKSEEQLLTEMRKTTRYLIKKAHRDGVTIEKRTDLKAVDDFYKIYEETAKREYFVPFSKQYIRHEFETFNKTGSALFLFGKLTNISAKNSERQHLASALILFTKSTAFYHQGASIHTKIPVTYALQWEAIKEAKKRGCQFYNFWGILQEGRTPKSWAGLTLFKQGFGGNQIDYLLTQDYRISFKYFLTYLSEKLLFYVRNLKSSAKNLTNINL